MIKLKSLKKKLVRLEARMAKNARKLEKLQRQVQIALRAESRSKPVNGAAKRPESIVLPAKKKRELTPAGRAKLSALMKARWEAKRAATVPFVDPHRVEA